ncbi:hypothetical protein BDN72DRAFT_485098 [Pluteus cervinus]|uniref:Uncharacterized protein n=1 Tax=Pluteus cervinus TaxID=181527 RepID=A0ACD3A8A2_9AGAR|nr:hypothetical protein BDN72DRAFT_485098 [Pluteus cervinus]
MHPEIPENKRHHRFFISEEFITLKSETDPEYFAPLVQGITVVDLERFLATLFPTEYGQYDATSFDEWASILKVAHYWEFESIIKLALEKIEPVSSPVDKVVLGKTYNIPEWAVEARVLLCRREEPITLEEASRMGIEEVVNISTTRHRIRSSEIRFGMQDSTIRSILSGEEDEEENVVAEVALPPAVPEAADSDPDSTTTLSQSSVKDAPVDRKDPRICRAIELRTELKVLKKQLAAAKESEDVETQIDDLEEEYLRLYKGLSGETGQFRCLDRDGSYIYDAVLSITRTSLAELCVQSMLTGCLHPDARRIQALCIHFPLYKTKDGIRKLPQQITLNVLNRYGLKYTIDATKGNITVPIAF